MKHNIFLILRLLTGFVFCWLFFDGFIRFYTLRSYIGYYISSFVFAILYLYASYLTAHYKMHYFFEIKKELILKSILILLMFGCAIFLNCTFEFALKFQNKNLIAFYYILIYIGFDIITEVAIVATSYQNSYDKAKYRNKSKIIIHYIENQKLTGNEIEDKIGNLKRLPKARLFTPLKAPAYDFFVDHEGECCAFYEKDFYIELMEFSKANQLFYGKKIDDENHILDTRCNVVCINKEKFSFYDHCGKKCTFTMKFNRNTDID